MTVQVDPPARRGAHHLAIRGRQAEGATQPREVQLTERMRPVTCVPDEDVQQRPARRVADSPPGLQQPIRRDQALLQRHTEQECRLSVGAGQLRGSDHRPLHPRPRHPRREERRQVAAPRDPHPLHDGPRGAMVWHGDVDEFRCEAPQAVREQRCGPVEPSVGAALPHRLPPPAGPLWWKRPDRHGMPPRRRPAPGSQLGAHVVSVDAQCHSWRRWTTPPWSAANSATARARARRSSERAASARAGRGVRSVIARS